MSPAPRFASLSLAFLSLVSTAAGGLGCAQTAPTIGAPHSITRGGDASVAVNINLTLALGDEVAKAAADAAKSILSGGITDMTKGQAIEGGVEAGLKKATEMGKTPTEAEKEDLRKKLEESVNKLKNNR